MATDHLVQPPPILQQDNGVVCLAKPPRIARTRSAVAYDELSRSLAIRLKYGRKIAIACEITSRGRCSRRLAK